MATTPFVRAGCDRYACYSDPRSTFPVSKGPVPADGLRRFPGVTVGLLPTRHAPCAMHHAQYLSV
ncbi:uncharacterized protein N7496_012660 [Penicillium cataractarum]|uniref:Uncharacterized protein n=1 Tax=Penicillium cataractarum TaxID=2100454 RepID=A0A9W9US37_9EURO|nr:uncharacterized protein N7496_012660 [Penicillium cataractarum]KAJ5355448.1 hypothetical protein N7496_012660 [Penicillium cataractarum]